MTTTIHFSRQPNGAYAFESLDGETFEARKRNVDGWELYRIDFAEGRENAVRLDGWFASRIDAAAAALGMVPAGKTTLVQGRCESGWTGDRCTRPLFHDGPHSNER